MDFDYKSIYGFLAGAIVFATWIYYAWNIYRRVFRPHAFPFLIYSVIGAIGCAGMLAEGAGGTAWRTGLVSLLFLINFFLTARQGLGYVKKFDVIMLGIALLGIPVWMLTDNPRAALLFLLVVELFGAAPAWRKAYVLPYEDSITSNGLTGLSMLLSLVAIPNYAESWASALYISVWILCSLSIVCLLAWRRQVIPADHSTRG